MASIYPNRKNGKILSFKFKTFLGRDENGKQIFKCTTWTPEITMSESKLLLLAEKEATVWERRMQEEFIAQKQALEPNEITFENFVKQIWLPAQQKQKDLRPSTLSFQNSMLKNILPSFTGVKIRAITSAELERFLEYLKNEYRTKQNKPLAPKTIRHHYAILNLIFDYAVKNDYIASNPLSKVDSPRLVKHKVDALSNGEVLSFIKEVNKLPQMQRLMYTLLLTTGIRRGECFGLQWGDIDLKNCIIRIERNVTYTAFKGISVGLPKTNTGIREIPITDGVVALLIDYKKCEEQNGFFSEHAFLFHATDAPLVPHDPTYITTHMKRFMKRIGLPDMSPHDLRHTCASLLIQSGADIKSVQDILGHADASTTLNFYARSNLETMRGATAKAFDFD